MPLASAWLVLYVSDQASAREFYRDVLGVAPEVDEEGMTAFRLTEGAVLGLMPVHGIRLLLPAMPDPARAAGIPRAELYLVVPDAAACHARAVARGATELSPLLARPWGDRCAYALDPDGHVLAFAEPPEAVPDG